MNNTVPIQNNFTFFFFSFEKRNATIDGYFTEMSCIQFYRIYIERKCIFPFFSSCDGWFSLDFSYVHIAFKFRNLTSLHWGLSCHLHKFRAGGTMGQGGHCPPHILSDLESKQLSHQIIIYILLLAPQDFQFFRRLWIMLSGWRGAWALKSMKVEQNLQNLKITFWRMLISAQYNICRRSAVKSY